MRFTICIICKEDVIVSNTKDGICKNCWYRIDTGKEPEFSLYEELDISLEIFPKLQRLRGRFTQ